MTLWFFALAVALCAGPHNAVVLRYALARVPARPGPLAGYVALGTLGTVGLAAGSVGLALVSMSPELGRVAHSVWLSLFVLWVAALAWMRAAQAPRRDWSGLAPVAVLALGVAWGAPAYGALALVYLHPLVALAVLDRELARTRRAWVGTYRRALVLVALGAALVAGSQPAGTPPAALARHAGAHLLPSVSPLALVSVHAYLELVHYAVWLVAIPSLALGPVPLARRSAGARRGVRALLALSGVAVVALWIGFAIDAETTRDVYFVLATGHVLAEVPLLLRLL